MKTIAQLIGGLILLAVAFAILRAVLDVSLLMLRIVGLGVTFAFIYWIIKRD